jgi:hypothetical protein
MGGPRVRRGEKQLKAREEDQATRPRCDRKHLLLSEPRVLLVHRHRLAHGVSQFSIHLDEGRGD